MNIPNTLTAARVLFAVLLFAVLPFQWYKTAIVLFVVAAVTDFVDGWWARRFHQITVFGRIMDPFADKLLVCGTLIAMLGDPILSSLGWYGFQPWMVIVIVARELWVTSLRAAVEQRGGDFSAKWIGKWKMVLQCTAILTLLFGCALSEGRLQEILPVAATGLNLSQVVRIVFGIGIAAMWGTLLITLWSGVTYTIRAFAMAERQ